MSDASERRGFLFSNTLTELAFVMFFLLLLLALTQLRSMADESQTLAAKVEQLERQAATAAALSELPDSVRQPTLDLARDLATTLSGYPEEEAIAILDTLEALPPEDWTVLNPQPGDPFGANLPARLDASRQKERDCRIQIGIIEDNCKGNGLELPPCWPDDDGRPEYAFEVTLREQSVLVQRIWPPHRDGEAMRIPSMSQLASAGQELSTGTFRALAAPILAWSDAQTPRCRHFVRILDDTETKTAFKQQLLTVEGYFYKFLVPDSRVAID